MSRVNCYETRAIASRSRRSYAMCSAAPNGIDDAIEDHERTRWGVNGKYAYVDYASGPGVLDAILLADRRSWESIGDTRASGSFLIERITRVISRT